MIRTINRMFAPAALVAVCLISGQSTVFADPAPMPGVNGPVKVIAPPGVYHTSWVGNAFGGDGGPNGFGYWVQGSVNKLVVTPDGTAVCGCAYDEAGRCVGLYKAGKVNRVLLQEHNGHGETAWGWGTANNGIAVDGQDLYVANTGKKLLHFHWTPGDLDSAVYIGETDLRAAATGLTALNGKIAVCDATGIELRSATNMQPNGSFAITGATDAVFAPDGSLWILAASAVHHYASDGRDLGDAIPNLQKPTALAWDNQGNLIICDDGPREQVLFYRVAGTPHLVRSFGIQGGLSSGTPGQVEPKKLFGIRGAGTDAQGNITVAMSLTGASGGGTFLRSFTPSGVLRWELKGMAFVDTYGFDPDSDGKVVYGRYAKFDLDLNKVVPGSEWGLSAITMPYPAGEKDGRLTPAASVVVRNLDGHRFLYMIGQYAGGYRIYSFQPDKGNLAYEVGKITGDDKWAWDVDTKGDIWNGDGPNKTIRRYQFAGIKAGAPQYDWDHPQSWPWPEGWDLIRRSVYVSATDSLYVFGYLHGQNIESWGVLGSAAIRYDGWLSGHPRVVWTVSQLPLNPTGSDSGKLLTPNGVEICGDYMFVGMVKPDVGNHVYTHILRLSDGQYIGSLVPGPEVGEGVGWLDMPYAISALKRKDGEYLVLEEEDWRSKNLLYRWRP